MNTLSNALSATIYQQLTYSLIDLVEKNIMYQ